MQNVVPSDKKFLNLFPELALSTKKLEILKNVELTNISVYKKSRRLEISIVSKKLISAQILEDLEQSLVKTFELESVYLKISFKTELSLTQSLLEYWDSIIYLICKKNAMNRGIMSDCKWELIEKKLLIKLQTKGVHILKSKACDIALEDMIFELFSQRIKVEFRDSETDESVKAEYLKDKFNEESKVIDFALKAQGSCKSPNGRRKKKADGSAHSSIEDIIVGKIFNDKLLKMIDVTQESGKVALQGEVFRVEFREIRGDRYIFIFDITDFTSSLTMKLFVEKGDIDHIKERIKPGIVVRVKGEAQYDKFSKELTIFASDIIEIENEIRLDTAEEKRVELHLHTQMSAMDGITPVKELVKRAAYWGHKAIAITDHGVVQAYPDAYEAARENKIKIIYGIECYLLDDSIPIVYKPNGQSLEEEFVVVDIETTGLNSDKDKITEIGAVKIRGGKIIDKFSCFVNPGIPIPSFIVKLTGITDEMVKDSPAIEYVLTEFLQFANNATLVAHNANFDLGFIRHFARIIGEKVNNSVVDTLQLCRNLFPELGKYKLSVIAKHLGIGLENQHRAVDDSRATAEIFLNCIEKLKDKDVKTINDIQNLFAGNDDYKKANSYHAIILVKNYTGLRNLYKIVSHSHLKYHYKKPRVPKKLFMTYKEGLIIGSACEAGELYRAILENKSEEDIKKISLFYDYLEIQPLANNQFLINNGKIGSQEELRNINRKIVELGEKFNKPVVATCDVHFMDPRDEVFRRILMSGQGFADADNQAPLFLRTTDEMLEEFNYLGKEKAYEVVIQNTNKISDMVDEIAPVPSGTFPPKIEGAEEEIKYLAQKRSKELYGEPLPEIVATRLEKELNSIIKNGFAVMYIIAQKLVSKSLNDGYLVGSRGSVGSSFVANLVGITEVNSLQPHYICSNCKYSEFVLDSEIDCGFDLPDKVCPECGKPLSKDGYDIPFETFLGFDGDKEPDIDLNFSGDYQAIAHKYTEELFGEGHVFRAGTIGSVADKTAYGFVKNYLDEREIIVTNAEVNRLVKGCTGIKRTTGQHPGGIMIIPQDKEIYDFSPIQRPADDVDSNITTTHFDYHFLHGSILKLDILGHDDPTVIKMLEGLTGVDARTIPIGEKRTMGIFSSTKAIGVEAKDISSEVGTFAIPEFGTKFVRQMLVDTMPKTFSELIRISGLSHGTDVWLNNAQNIIRDQTATLAECICCRDDIMIYLMHKGLVPKTAFKIMEDVRKGKGLRQEYEQVMKENNVPKWYIESCKTIKYMFPKAHAAAYVMMAFRIAWFKVYYPEAFYATYFTVRADDFDAEMMTRGQDLVRNKIKEYEQKGNNLSQKEKNVLTILEVANEMYARKIKFLPVDLYKSDALKFEITPEGIRPPLNSLQGLGTNAALNIVESRKAGDFLSFDELRLKAKISKTVIEILQKHGCLKGMPESNQLSFF